MDAGKATRRERRRVLRQYADRIALRIPRESERLSVVPRRQLYDWWKVWAATEELEATFYPASGRRDNRGRLGDWDYDLVWRRRKITDDTIARLFVLSEWEQRRDWNMTPVLNAITRWVIERQDEQIPVEALEATIDRVRYVMRKKHGRPRKDDSTRTIVIRPEYAADPVIISREGARWSRVRLEDRERLLGESIERQTKCEGDVCPYCQQPRHPSAHQDDQNGMEARDPRGKEVG